MFRSALLHGMAKLHHPVSEPSDQPYPMEYLITSMPEVVELRIWSCYKFLLGSKNASFYEVYTQSIARANEVCVFD